MTINSITAKKLQQLLAITGDSSDDVMLKSEYSDTPGFVDRASHVPFSGIADKPTTLAEWGITDAIVPPAIAGPLPPENPVYGQAWIEESEGTWRIKLFTDDGWLRIYPPYETDEFVDQSLLTNSIIQDRHLSDGAITTLKIAPGAVTFDQLADLAVDTAKLDDGAVTYLKLALESVKLATLHPEVIAWILDQIGRAINDIDFPSGGGSATLPFHVIQPGVAGVIGNGTSDDTLAIRNLLNLRGVFYVKNASYAIANLDVPDSVFLIGEPGAEFVAWGTDDIDSMFTLNGNRIVFKGLSFNGNDVFIQAGIRRIMADEFAETLDTLRIEDCEFTNFGCGSIWTQGIQNVMVRNCDFDDGSSVTVVGRFDPGEDGYLPINNVKIVGNRLAYTDIVVNGVATAIIADNEIFNAGISAINNFQYGIEGGPLDPDPWLVVIRDNTLINPDLTAIELKADFSKLLNNNIYFDQPEDMDEFNQADILIRGFGLEIVGNSGLTLIGEWCYNGIVANNSFSKYVSFFGGREMSIKNNNISIFREFWVAGFPALELQGSKRYTIEGNTIVGFPQGESQIGEGIQLSWTDDDGTDDFVGVLEYSGEENTVRNNYVRGFGWSIYDDRQYLDGGDSRSWNVIENNRCETIVVNADEAEYQGYIAGNRPIGGNPNTTITHTFD